MQNYKKCGIIGCGNVGATTAYTLMLSGIFNELVLVDIDTARASGEAEDIAHGMPFNSPIDIYTIAFTIRIILNTHTKTVGKA